MINFELYPVRHCPSLMRIGNFIRVFIPNHIREIRRSCERGTPGLIALIIATLHLGFPTDVTAASERNAPWPKLPNGRIVIEYKGVQLGFPTDQDSLDGFYFRSRSSSPKSIRLRKIVEDPKKWRHVFSQWPAMIIVHSYPRPWERGKIAKMPLEKRTRNDVIAAGSYSIQISPSASRWCRGESGGVYKFAYGNIRSTNEAPPFDRTNYIGCYGLDVRVIYVLYRRYWTAKTAPRYQEQITRLFDAILINRNLRKNLYDHQHN